MSKPISSLIITNTDFVTVYADGGLLFMDARNDRKIVNNEVREVVTGDDAVRAMERLEKVDSTSKPVWNAYFDSSLLSILVQKLGYDEYSDLSTAPCVHLSVHQQDDKTPPYLQFEWCNDGHNSEVVHLAFLMPTSGAWGNLAKVHGRVEQSNEQAEGSAECNTTK